jgi:hypothetical protein
MYRTIFMLGKRSLDDECHDTKEACADAVNGGANQNVVAAVDCVTTAGFAFIIEEMQARCPMSGRLTTMHDKSVFEAYWSRCCEAYVHAVCTATPLDEQTIMPCLKCYLEREYTMAQATWIIHRPFVAHAASIDWRFRASAMR